MGESISSAILFDCTLLTFFPFTVQEWGRVLVHKSWLILVGCCGIPVTEYATFFGAISVRVLVGSLEQLRPRRLLTLFHLTNY